MKKRSFSRRSFIKKSGVAAVTGYAFLNFSLMQNLTANNQTRVVLIRDKNLFDNEGNVVPDVLNRMLDQSMKRLFQTSSAEEAWQKIIQPEDVVGLKTNVWNYLPTPPALEQAVKKRVLETGVSEENIRIKDRGILDDSVFQRSTALINMRPMRTHDWAGVGSLIKNYIMFHPKPWEYHPDTCADLAEIWQKPLVKGKTRLNILVMFTPLFHGIGPHHFNKKYIWKYQGMLLGTDPVAVDRMGLAILQSKREQYFGEEKPINPPPKHIYIADSRHHLGTADLNKIDLIKMGWQEDNLI